MSDENLLSRMTTGGTQNANESFNNIVWVYCPKTVFVGYSTVLSAVQSAVVRFNAGSLAVTDKLKHLSIEPTAAQIACAQLCTLHSVDKVCGGGYGGGLYGGFWFCLFIDSLKIRKLRQSGSSF